VTPSGKKTVAGAGLTAAVLSYLLFANEQRAHEHAALMQRVMALETAQKYLYGEFEFPKEVK
jgi:hypothetical protein